MVLYTMCPSLFFITPTENLLRTKTKFRVMYAYKENSTYIWNREKVNNLWTALLLILITKRLIFVTSYSSNIVYTYAFDS